jgi:putative colanic acid biosynthesis acetyltransferase WcaF
MKASSVNVVRTDLSRYDNSWYKPGRNLVVRLMWYSINTCLFRTAFPFYGPKRFFLRMFGATVGKGLVIKPHVSIKYPWKLKVGNHVWIGEGAWIDNLAEVTLMDNACVSQGVLLLCGNHNYKKATFDLIVKDIVLEEGAWAGAKSVVCPGVRMEKYSLLTVGSIAVRSLEAGWIYQGNPATKVKKREFRA